MYCINLNLEKALLSSSDWKVAHFDTKHLLMLDVFAAAFFYQTVFGEKISVGEIIPSVP
jgi:hypothetical protein